MCFEYLVGAVSQLLAIHFSPLMTSHPPWYVERSTAPSRPLSGSMKLLYHIMAVPFFGGSTRFAEWQLMLRLNSFVAAFEFSISWKQSKSKKGKNNSPWSSMHTTLLAVCMLCLCFSANTTHFLMHIFWVKIFQDDAAVYCRKSSGTCCYWYFKPRVN